MDDQSIAKRVPKKWMRMTLVIAATALIVAPLTAVASHSFDDVPDTNIFHGDIEWLKDADVTRGCNPPANTEYCPTDNVTRQQMAAFMNRLANNRVVNAATAVTAGTALEAVNEAGTQLTGTDLATADSIATLQDVRAGAYVVTASWTGSAQGEDAGALIVCQLSAGTTTTQVTAQVSNPDAGQHSMGGVLTATIDQDGSVNLSCWREDASGEQTVSHAHLVAYPVMAVQSSNVSG